VDVPETLRSALADRYAIEREIGQGGMATVYLARDLKHDRRVALKVLRPELTASLGLDRFLREIRTTAQLTHPHILPLLDSGDAAGTLFYVMPYVEGESLRDRLTREKQLPLDDALQLTREVADALSYAHAHGVVHRDIKPENILIESGHAVVADFGIAKAIAAAGSERLTETGLSIGTPAYMSPEQAAGSQDVDGRSDLYSLGCVLYEMLSGETPYTGPTPQAILAKKLSAPVPLISVVRDAVSANVEAALSKALARTPADRFSTAALFAEALSGASTARPALRAPRRRVWLSVSGALGVVLLGVAGWWVATRSCHSAIQRLAVLPLASFTNDTTQDYFVQGVHDALISNLQEAGLTVLGRTSVLQYRRTEKPPRQIARELGVDALIEGTVMRSGDSMAIAVRLIDGRTEVVRWEHTYPGEVRSVFALYHGVTRAIAEQVQSALSPAAAAKLATARTVDPQAYEDYLKGQFHWQRLTPADLDQAYEYFQRALRRDSTYALAWVGISLVWAGRNLIRATASSEAAPKEIAAARRALELDSSLAEAQYTIALALTWQEWDWAGAERAFRRAIEINPNYPDVRAFYSHYLHIMKRPNEARAQMDSALALDPLNALFRGLNGVALWFEGRPADAVGEFRKALDGGNAALGGNVVQALVHVGRPEEALAELRKLFAGDAEALDGLSRGYAVGGFRGAMRRLAEISAARPSSMSGGPFAVANWFARAGDRERTLEWLTRGVDVRDPNAPYLGVWPEFVFVHDDARFQALCRRIGLPS
jgi:TolB-like protein/tRNA A-37 threonylcarbamoyl transferase component Bud32